MTSLVATNVCVDIPILSRRARSLRTVAIAKARNVGGKMVSSGTDVSVVRALDNITFSLKAGDRLGLVGPNGAGKTTLIRALADIYSPTAGSIRREGTLVPMFDINIGFDDESTGYENIILRGLMSGLTQRQITATAQAIADFSGLGDYIDLPIRTYSAGMLLRLMFSIATSVQGNIVLMDEWLAVGDAEFRLKANARLKEITDRAGILVIASHDENLLRSICNLGMRIESGRMVEFGPIADVLATKPAAA
ncbi:ABC transporter ATP-binding protein [Aureimonas sp. SA4125]|uniref:ABC transporter ATP-binding protein n=1 Tax=Aureimonas sp. SA4125 TaxID=2826993 RepID=UPI001CC55C6A|nr:ABC transporter ATP-binding protein [Aureimonas sp. SA4125]BDA83957.1 ABC transporter ATP-binding protein [Aureimonas sp. SA4125]